MPAEQAVVTVGRQRIALTCTVAAMCARACMCAHACVIKIIILYFIQIRHTDDFPSTGTRLVFDNSAYLFIRMVDLPISPGLVCNYYQKLHLI